LTIILNPLALTGHTTERAASATIRITTLVTDWAFDCRGHAEILEGGRRATFLDN
jgi:hypothetical protein